MTVTELLYAQSLRVIGQELEAFNTTSFILEKAWEEYILNFDVVGLPEKPLERRSFFKGITRKFLGSADSHEETAGAPTPQILRFGIADIYRMENERRIERRPSTPTDAHKLSLMLRVLGDYLDRRRSI